MLNHDILCPLLLDLEKKPSNRNMHLAPSAMLSSSIHISYKLANKNPSMALRFVSGLLASDCSGIGSGSGFGGASSTFGDRAANKTKSTSDACRSVRVLHAWTSMCGYEHTEHIPLPPTRPVLARTDRPACSRRLCGDKQARMATGERQKVTLGCRVKTEKSVGAMPVGTQRQAATSGVMVIPGVSEIVAAAKPLAPGPALSHRRRSIPAQSRSSARLPAVTAVHEHTNALRCVQTCSLTVADSHRWF
eukprot:COSAG02_NODE_6604_length_3466_cov_3.836650_3_plen_248_part_00